MMEETTSKSKIDRIKYAIAALCWLIAMPLALLSVALKPLYKMVYYGQANAYFKYGIAIALMIIFFFVVRKIEKVLKLDYTYEKKSLSWAMLAIIYFSLFVIVFIISACYGFQLKPINDVGNNMPAFKMGQFFTKLAYQAICLFFSIEMIKNFQCAFDGLFKFKKEIFNKYIPWGGICTMLTYGIYGAFMHVGASLYILYIFYPLIYGFIYLLCNRSILKSYAFCLLLFVL